MTAGLTETGLGAPRTPANPDLAGRLGVPALQVPGLVRAFDAASVPQTTPPGCRAAIGYLGLAPDPDPEAAHAWTLEEWLRFSHLRQLPTWLAQLGLDPVQNGKMAADAARRLGWRTFAQHRRAILLDMETWDDVAWVNAFADQVWEGGYCTWLYGSEAFVLADPARGGYIVADWDGLPDLPPGHSIIGHQYAADVPFDGTTVDYTVIDSAFVDHLGIGPRQLVAA